MKKTMLFIMLATLITLSSIGSVGFAEVKVSCKSAILINEFGDVLFAHNETEKRPIASMTKIMTLICIYDEIEKGNLSLDQEISVSQNASSMGGSQVYLDANTQHKVENLIKSIIICSANDSCVALAEHVSGSVENFVDKMNEKAVELNLVGTHFANCTGLPAVDGYSNAKDVSTMMQKLISYPHYFKCANIWMEDYVHPSGRITGMTNTNKLSKFYQGCDGGKTGYTSEAKHCLCATAKRNETRFIAVVIGANDSKTRFQEVSNLLNYGFANYQTKIYLDKNSPLDPIQIPQAKEREIEVVLSESLYQFGQKNEKCKVKIEYLENLKAPLKQGETVGFAKLLDENENVLKTVEILTKDAVKEKTIFDYFKEFFNHR